MRRFAAAVFAAKRDKSADSTAGSSADVSLLQPDPPSKKSWKTWFKSASNRHKVALAALPVCADSTTDDTDSTDDTHPPTARLATIIANSFVTPVSLPPSPFAHPPSARSTFPRSANSPNTVTQPKTLRATVLKRRLHRRLLTHSLPQPFGCGFIPPVIPVEPPPSVLLDLFPSPTTVISLSSPGLTRWMSRPCFEDRYAVYVPSQDGSILRQPVSAASFAVADLEFTVALEAMVNPDPPLLITTPPTPIPDAPPSPPPRSFLIVHPSPLRNEHGSSEAPVPNTRPRTPPPINGPEPPPTVLDEAVTAPEQPAKRGVHFSENDEKDDIIPLSYVLRQNQKRQEKAQFLKAEAGRRALQEQKALEQEKLRLKQERARQDAERMQWEKERKASEKAKKLLEEQKQRMYADQVAAARIRREAARAGGMLSLKLSNNDQPGGFLPTAPSERNGPPSVRGFSRQDEIPSALITPRREAFEQGFSSVPAAPPSHHDSSNSPGSSRPPSLGTPPTPSSLGAPPTPPLGPGCPPQDPEDVRAAVAAAMQRTKKRSSFSAQSLYSNSNGSLTGDRTALYSAWTGSNPSLHTAIPPVPQVPMIPATTMIPPMMPMGYVMMDMPLLPPTPPFMMQQYSRQSGSHGSGSGSSKGNLSRESSRERVPKEGSGRRDSQGSHHGQGHPPRSNSFPEQLHSSYKHPSVASSSRSHIPPSGSGIGGFDPRRSSLPSQSSHYHEEKLQGTGVQRRPPATYGYPYPRVERKLESPWTGVPTASGKLPNGMSQSKSAHSQSTLKGPSLRGHAS